MLVFKWLVGFEILIDLNVIRRIILNPSTCSADPGLGVNDRWSVEFFE